MPLSPQWVWVVSVKLVSCNLFQFVETIGLLIITGLSGCYFNPETSCKTRSSALVHAVKMNVAAPTPLLT